MLGAKQAELDIRQDERKSYDKIEAELRKEEAKKAKQQKKANNVKGLAPSSSSELLPGWNITPSNATNSVSAVAPSASAPAVAPQTVPTPASVATATNNPSK
jgi:hypothetical protein